MCGFDADTWIAADGGAGILRAGSEGGNSGAIKEVLCALQDMGSTEPIIIADAQKSAELKTAHKSLAELGTSAILALPLSNGEDSVGDAGADAQQAADLAPHRCRGAEDAGRSDGDCV